MTELSFVVPVYNGSRTVGAVVDEIHERYPDIAIQVVLVNDGSDDDSEQTCRKIQEMRPDTVVFVHLARNFGEHSAVLAGLHQTTGRYVAVLDDDGQNPPGEVRRLYDAIRDGNRDVVYGCYRAKRHSRFRNLGSRFNDRVATLMLQKPADLYLSSFRILNRFVVDEITRYRGSFPYIDGLILRTTRNLGQVEVAHHARADGKSNYTIGKLVHLWLNMFLNFSILPLRVAALLGSATASISLVMLVAVVVDKLVHPDVPVGVPTILMTITFFAGVQLLILGAIGEYLGRLFLDQTGSPQFVVRYVQEGRS